MYSRQLCIDVCICKSDIIILILKLVNVYIGTARFSKTQPLASYIMLCNMNNNKHSFYCQPSVNLQYTTAAS